MKRTLSFILCICITLSIFTVAAVSVFADYDETSYVLTGKQAEDIVGIARTQIGYRESGDNVTKYGEWFGRNVAWCDVFVSWCAAKAGISSSVIPQKSFGGAESGMAWFVNRGLFKYASSGYTPKAGDIAFLDWNDNNSPDHVGIVSHIDSSGAIHIIDGNFSDKVNDHVFTNGGYHHFRTSEIMGYATPAYTDSVTDVPGNTEITVDAYYKVATSEAPLMLRSSPSVGSVVAEMPKGSVIHVTKTTVYGGSTWGYAEYNGSTGWCHMGYTQLIANAEDIKISAFSTSDSIRTGESITLTGDIQPAPLAEYGCVWSSSDESVATVDSNGRVTAVNPGSAVITLKSKLDIGQTASLTVTVHNSPLVNKGYYKVSTSETLSLRSEPSLSAAVIAYIPNNTHIKVTNSRIFDGYTWGYVEYNGLLGWCALDYTQFIADDQDAAVSVSYTSLFIRPDEGVAVKGTITPEALAAAGGVWSSSDTSVAAVDSDGNVKGVGDGNAVVTFASFVDPGLCAKVSVKVISGECIDGDANFDGTINVSDIIQIKSVIVGSGKIGGSLVSVCDVNHDGFINVSDILSLKNMILHYN